jgi:hypothetical protein
MNHKRLITFDEYCENHYKDDSNMIRYINGFIERDYSNTAFPPELYIGGMLEWNKKDASNWAGPYEDDCVLLRVYDHTHTCPTPKTIAQHKLDQAKYEEYSSYNFPRVKFLKVFPEASSFACFIILTKDGKQCGRSELTHIEYMRIMQELTPDEKLQREILIKKHLEDKYLWYHETPSKEFPLILSLHGTDDLSYSRVFANRQDVQKELNALKTYGNNFDYIYKNYVFTN